MNTTVRIGESYMESNERQRTEITVDGTDFTFVENLWEDDGGEDGEGKFETGMKWSVTVHLEVEGSCRSKDEVMTAVQDNVKILKALGFLGYELHDMLEPGVGVWDRPAPNR